jgi:hypothetical protein
MKPFLQTLLPGTPRICGHEMPPLTLWRLTCLHAIGSPLLTGASFDLADLLLAIRAVSTPNLTPPDLRPTFRHRWHYRRHKKNSSYLEEQASIFMRWLSLHQTRPELWQPEDDSETRSITAPPVLSQVCALMECGLTHSEAWDTSPGYASWMIAARAERNSDRVQFVDDIEDEQIEAMLDELEQRDETAIIAQAKADLPSAVFEKWLAARQIKHAKP